MVRKTISLLFSIVLLYQSAFASEESGKCVGKIMNPITDICWSCLFPITIGSIPIARSSKFKDTKNPSLPVCFCNRGPIPLVPGVAVGFWEPIRMIEVTRTPYCLVSQGGIKIATGFNQGDTKKIRSENEKRSKAYYHTHYYVYPLLFLLNLVSDLGCMDMSSYDLAYLSEFDPSYKSDKIANLLHPETFLLSNPIAKAACSVECITATATKKPIDLMFWCSGCQGSLYPFTGTVEGHIGGVATSTLLAARQVAKLHRLGLAKKTATNDSSPNGALCKSRYLWRVPKSQYRLQMTYPRPNATGNFSCNNIGMSDVTWSSGREYPYKGEDFAYMLWRKKNCCIL